MLVGFTLSLVLELLEVGTTVLDSIEVPIGECTLVVLVRIPTDGDWVGCIGFDNGMLFKLMTFLFSMLPMLSECKEDGVMGSEDMEDATSLLVRPLVELVLTDELDD